MLASGERLNAGETMAWRAKLHNHSLESELGQFPFTIIINAVPGRNILDTAMHEYPVLFHEIETPSPNLT